MTFERNIRPIFKAYCFDCHGEGEKLRGSLDLRLARLAMQGGDTGPAIVPGKAEKSYLLDRLHKQEMPPGKVKLKKRDIDLIARWIDSGAKTDRPEPHQLAKGFHISAEEKNFWAFKPVRQPSLPKVKNQKMVRNPIDAFLLEKLETRGLSFSPKADRRTLIRRATLDLIGLPPTPQEVENFVQDRSPDAYEKMIDRLLNSPRYGERWARHWLDAAGYADSEGYSNEDQIRPHAYKYRDYVIRSFQNDKPFDQFILEQLAGDELVRSPLAALTPADKDKLIATGFLRMAPDGTGTPGVDQPLARNQVIADTLQIVGTSLLGLSLHCAQCHNHRYDPIPQVDYYRIRAIFEPALDWKNWRTPARRQLALLSAVERKKSAEIEKEAARIDEVRLKKQEQFIRETFSKQIQKVPDGDRLAVRKAYDTLVGKRTDQQKKLLQRFPFVNVSAGSLYLYDGKAASELKKLSDQASQLRAKKPAPEVLRVLTEVPGKIPLTHLFHRGDHEQPKEAVQPAGLSILADLKLGDIPVEDKSLPSSGRRLAFANRLTSGKHPLVPRVWVNRVWHHHFGRGIVGSPGDFGFLGDRPSHPELLDWLALEFIKKGWRLKPLHRLILTSSAYRQSAQRTPVLEKIDPDNHLLGRMNTRRLEGEIVRDAMLSVCGKLNPRQFGPPIPVTQDENGQVILGVDTRDGAGRFSAKIASLGEEAFRRSIYVQVRRSQPLSILDSFDAPTMSPNCEARSFSTVATQSLLLMNSQLVLDLAKYFSQRLEKEAGTAPAAQVRLAWKLAYAREPSTEEMDQALTFLRDQGDDLQSRQKKSTPGAIRQQALATFCQALLSSNRFLYVD